MALTAYLTQTQALLQNPGAPSTLYSTTDVTRWINLARGQIAGEGECVRVQGTISTVVAQRSYSFSSLTVSSVAGVAGPIQIRSILFNIASGQKWVRPRGYPWFTLYKLNNPVPKSGPPEVWSQFGQGVNGTFYLDPLPDIIYTLTCDCVCYPNNLAIDGDPEPIPYLWTDAVPFLAAYYALLSAQMGQRQADADRMFARYQEFMARARKAATPAVTRGIYEQSGDPTQLNKLGVQQSAGGR